MKMGSGSKSRVTWIAWVLMVTCVFFEAGSPARAAVMETADIVDHLVQVQETWPETASFRQDITMRALFRTWRFTGQVVKSGPDLRATMQGAPSFLPEEVAVALLDIRRTFGAFDLSLAGEETRDKVRYYLVDGERKPDVVSGARSGRIWVDSNTWLIQRAEAVYWWGRLEVEQTYRDEAGFTVLDGQDAVIRPLGIRLTIDYQDYRFPAETAQNR